jgi:hypothetical protein
VPAPKIPLHVEVDRAEFVRGFRALQAAEPHERKRATVTFDGSRFSIQLGEVSISASGSGTWAGEVRITGRDFRALNVHFAEAGSPRIVVRMADGRFFIGSVSAPCTWRPSTAR